jgi:hypothetical protein
LSDQLDQRPVVAAMLNWLAILLASTGSDSEVESAATKSQVQEVPRTGIVLRLYGQGLAGFVGGAFYHVGDEPVISEAAFGFGGSLGFEVNSRWSLGIAGEVLFGGVDTDPLDRVEGFSGPDSIRRSVGVSTRFALTEGRGFRPYIGADGWRMWQSVRFSSDSGVEVPVLSRRTGRLIGFATVSDARFDSRHTGWAVGPVLGLRAKLSSPGEHHVDFFVEASAVREWWTAEGVEGSARANLEAAQQAADFVSSLQRSPSAWTTTVRIGLQFGP